MEMHFMPDRDLPRRSFLALALALVPLAPAGCVIPKVLGDNVTAGTSETDATTAAATAVTTDPTDGAPICAAGQGGDPGGTLSWTLVGDELPAYFMAAAINSKDQMVLVGTRADPIENGQVRLDVREADGSLVWERSYDGAPGLDDHGVAVVVGTDDGVYALVREQVLFEAGDPDQGEAATADAHLVVLHYAADGALLWRWEQDHPPVAAGEEYTPYGTIELIGDGVGVLVRSHDEAPMLIRLDALGAAASQVTLAAPAGLTVEQQALAADGSVILGGDLEGPMGEHALWVGRFAPNGALIWADTFGGLDDEPTALIPVASDGEVLMAWSTSTPGGTVNQLRRYGPAGAALWTVPLALTGLDSGVSSGALRCDGTVLLSGFSEVPPSPESQWGVRQELWVAAYTTGGAQLWARGLAFGEVESIGQPNDVVSTANGDAIVVGGFQNESDVGPWLGHFAGG